MVETTEQSKLLEVLFREMYDNLCGYANNILKNPELSEEAVQDTFRIACSKADELLQKDWPKSWLRSILKYVIRNIRRSRSRLNNLIIAEISLDDLVTAAPTRDMEMEIVLRDILKQEEYREFVMTHLEGRTMLQASLERGITLESCKKRVQRAKAKLKKYIIDNF